MFQNIFCKSIDLVTVSTLKFYAVFCRQALIVYLKRVSSGKCLVTYCTVEALHFYYIFIICNLCIHDSSGLSLMLTFLLFASNFSLTSFSVWQSILKWHNKWVS